MQANSRLGGEKMELDSEDICAAAALLRSKAGADGASSAAQAVRGAPTDAAPLPARRPARQAHAPSRYVAQDSPPAARGKRKAPHAEAAASQVRCDQQMQSRLQVDVLKKKFHIVKAYSCVGRSPAHCALKLFLAAPLLSASCALISNTA